MSPIGRIFGRGRAIENNLKKAEESFGQGDWEKCSRFAAEVRAKIASGNPGKFATELLRAFYLEASATYRRSDIEGALNIVDEALNQPDGLADIAKLLSEIVSENDSPKALQVLERASRKLPDNNHVALSLCEKYVGMEKFDEEAMGLYRKLYQRAPDNTTVIYGLAMALRKQDKFDRTTLAIYRRAFHEFSTNNDFLYGLARTYASQSPPVNEALPVIERALKFFPDEESFYASKIAILANLPSLTPDQVRILLETYKKTRDKDLAEQLVRHLMAMHADDEDACRVYEAVWKDHSKRTTLLSILAERYRMAGRRDPAVMEIFQAFFDEMPRERENTLYLARQYAEKENRSDNAILVFQQVLRDGTATELDSVVLALAQAYLAVRRSDEEAARIYRMAHSVEPDNYAILSALRDVAMAGGRMDGARANPLIDFIKHPNTSKENASTVCEKLGPVLASEARTDKDACHVYRLNVQSKSASPAEEALLVDTLIRSNDAKIGDIPLFERVYGRNETDDLAEVLAKLYRETGEPSEKRLPVAIRALKHDPGSRDLASWALPYILNQHGEDEEYFPLIAELVAKGHLAGAKGIRQGVVARSVTRIARDRIREGRFKEAIAVLVEAFKFDKNPILQYLLGVAYQGDGDLQTGLGVFRDLRNSDKQNPAYSYRLAVLTLMGGDIDGAEKMLQELSARFPDHPMVHLRMGMIDEARKDPDKALKEYEQVRSGDKSVVAFADYRKGMILCSKDEWQEGLKYLDTAAGGGIKTAALENARMLTRVTLIDKELHGGSMDMVERRLMRLSEHAGALWSPLINERLLRLALKQLKKGDDEAAQRSLEAAEKTGVRDARTSGLLAMIDIGAGRPKAAIERLERVLAYRDKTGAELAHRLWTVISLRLGRHDEAREAADWLMARKPRGAHKLRFLAVWRNPIEVDWPPALEEYTYEDLEVEFGFPVGLVGRMAYKCADYEGGAKYLEKYCKDQSKPDRVEAEFLLGVMYIKQKKPNLGLHYWSHILSEGHRELPEKQRVESLMLLGYHFMEHGETEKSREAFKLARESGTSQNEYDNAIAYSHLQAGYLAAKSDNLQLAIREWEKILETSPDNWQAIQNLGLAYFWMNDDDKSMDYFDRLFAICNDKADIIDQESFSFVFEETRKMINQLVSLKQSEPSRAEIKREMMLDETKSANRHYWTLGVKKGVTSVEAQANYFRLVKIYSPEKYPQDFMVLEKAYEFFNKPGLLKKNEQVVFNAFHFRLLNMEEAGGLSEIPPSPQIVEFLKRELDPRNQLDFDELLKESLSRAEKLPELNMTPDYMTPDYLASW